MRGRSKGARRFALAAAVYLLLAVVGQWVGRAVGLELPLAPGAVLALGLFWGAPIASGAALGVVTLDVLSGTFGVATSVGVLAQFLLVFVAVRLWGSFGRFSSGERPGERVPSNVVEYGLVAVTAAAVVGAASAWSAVLLGLAPFHAVVLDAGADVLASSLTVGAAVLYGYPAVLDDVDWAPAPARWTLQAGDASAGGGAAEHAGAATSGIDETAVGPVDGEHGRPDDTPGEWTDPGDSSNATTDPGDSSNSTTDPGDPSDATTEREDSSGDEIDPDGAGGASTAGVRVLALALAWVAAGYVVGIVFQGVDLVSRDVLINRAGRTAAAAIGLAGDGGRRVQVLGGAAAVALVLVVLYVDTATPQNS